MTRFSIPILTTQRRSNKISRLQHNFLIHRLPNTLLRTNLTRSDREERRGWEVDLLVCVWYLTPFISRQRHIQTPLARLDKILQKIIVSKTKAYPCT